MKLSPDTAGRIEAALPDGGHVLEIGCGDGALLHRLSALNRFTLSACEPDAERAGLAAQISGVPVVCAPAEKLPFEDGSFDAAILECVFSLCDPGPTLSELLRVLRPGGRAVVADLFATRTLTLSRSRMIRALYAKEQLESLFRRGFSLSGFEDLTHELRQHFAQLLMRGQMCACVDPAELPLLRAARPGYGIWIWTKR